MDERPTNHVKSANQLVRRGWQTRDARRKAAGVFESLLSLCRGRVPKELPGETLVVPCEDDVLCIRLVDIFVDEKEGTDPP